MSIRTAALVGAPWFVAAATVTTMMLFATTASAQTGRCKADMFGSANAGYWDGACKDGTAVGPGVYITTDEVNAYSIICTDIAASACKDGFTYFSIDDVYSGPNSTELSPSEMLAKYRWAAQRLQAAKIGRWQPETFDPVPGISPQRAAAPPKMSSKPSIVSSPVDSSPNETGGGARKTTLDGEGKPCVRYTKSETANLKGTAGPFISHRYNVRNSCPVSFMATLNYARGGYGVIPVPPNSTRKFSCNDGYKGQKDCGGVVSLTFR